jgi:hypothetical protein
MRKERKDYIERLRKNFEPTIDYTIGAQWFGVIPQGDGNYAIKIMDLKEFCGTWLNLNGSTKFETESGCAYAILNYLDKGEAR